MLNPNQRVGLTAYKILGQLVLGVTVKKAVCLLASGWPLEEADGLNIPNQLSIGLGFEAYLVGYVVSNSCGIQEDSSLYHEKRNGLKYDNWKQIRRFLKPFLEGV
ncbi:hypothetical protein LCGC14_2069360 [marine sediment metagenome]|uniref:Uncharacterized protein n=1 Tax=marine sediment metagenome TaxID=412755 RepID=A0A0F9HFX2_9ZZZZ